MALAWNGKGEKNQNSDNGSNIHDFTDLLKCAFILYRLLASCRGLDSSSGSSDLRKSYLLGLPELGLPLSTIRVRKRKKDVQVVRVTMCLMGRGQMVILNKSRIKIECYVHLREKIAHTINIQLPFNALCATCQRFEEKPIK